MAAEATMRVSEVTAFGGPEVLRSAERRWPSPAPDEVVVKIAAANVNPTDLAARSGAHRRRMADLTPPFVLGWDLAGVVSEVGESVSAYASGDWVVGMIPWVRIGGRVGAYAEAAAVDPGWLAPLPDDLDAVTAATVPLNVLTARQTLDLIAAPAGASLLITGASGAVGGFATQLAAQDGLHVIAVASDGDEDWVESLGAAEVVPRSADLARVGPVDSMLDAVPVGEPATQAVRDGGTIVFTRRIDLTSARELRVETPLVHSDAAALEQLTRQVASGRLRTRIAGTVDLDHAAEAHAAVEGGGLRGKVVLTTQRGGG